MRLLPLIPVLLLAGAVVAARASAAEVKIIANSSVGASSLSAEDLKSVFLVNKTSLKDGSHVEPVLEKEGPVHETFLKEFIGRSNAAMQTYYRSLVFSGKSSMPVMFASDAEVVAYVAKTKGAIGYVGSDTATAGVKVLEVK